MTDRTRDPLPAEEAARARTAIGEAIAALDETLEQFANNAATILQKAEINIARARDVLIEDLRQADPAPGERAEVRHLLEQLNVCVSLVHGVAYPMGGPKMKPLEMARDLLHRIRNSLTPSGVSDA